MLQSRHKQMGLATTVVCPATNAFFYQSAGILVVLIGRTYRVHPFDSISPHAAGEGGALLTIVRTIADTTERYAPLGLLCVVKVSFLNHDLQDHAKRSLTAQALTRITSLQPLIALHDMANYRREDIICRHLASMGWRRATNARNVAKKAAGASPLRISGTNGCWGECRIPQVCSTENGRPVKPCRCCLSLFIVL